MDAVDVVEFLTSLTHHNAFQSKMIYQSQLLGIQRRINKILSQHGYRLKSTQVPIGIQKAHKVSSGERRWGFEKVKTHSFTKRTSYKQQIEEEQKKRHKDNYDQAVKRVLGMKLDESLLSDFEDEIGRFDLESSRVISNIIV